MKPKAFIILAVVLLIAGCGQRKAVASPGIQTHTLVSSPEAVDPDVRKAATPTVPSPVTIATQKPDTTLAVVEDISLPNPSDQLLIRIIDNSHPVDDVFLKNIDTDLVFIESVYYELYGHHAPVKNENFKAHNLAVEDLSRMLKDAKDQGISLVVVSAFRDYESQRTALENVKGDLTRVNPPYKSEHHNGLTFDFSTVSLQNSLLDKFRDTAAGMFLQIHAADYGFVESYIANHDGIVSEPWHWTYLGKELVTKYLELKSKRIVRDVFDFQALYPQPSK